MTERYRRVSGFILPALGLLIAVLGCGDSTTKTETHRHANPLAADAVTRQEFFEHAIDNLHRLEDFQPQAMLDQVRQQLNESVDWNREVDWQGDPLIESLPDDVKQMELLRSLEDLKLNVYDASHLQEAVTLQSVSRVAVGGASSDLDRATRLFDWIVRNIQLTGPGELLSRDGKPIRVPHFPMEILFFGRGDSIDRAWAFVLLCRQQGLDAVVLALPPKTENAPPRPWVVGVMVAEDMYLFDPTLGLPLPGKNGRGVATLTEVAADDSVLRQLDLDAEHPYPVKAADLEKLTALVEASPTYLSRRMLVLEGKLAGEDKIVLTESAKRVADRALKFPQITEARLWSVPYERLVARFSPQMREATLAALGQEMLPYRIDLLPPEFQTPAISLQRGRVLHLKGIFAGEEGEQSANSFYQRARMADQDIDVPALNDTQRFILHRAKDDASYWLGLVAYERGRFETAIDHLQKRTIDANNGRWIGGARYNMGRAYESLGSVEKAIEAFEASTDPQTQGNIIRARELKARITPEKPAESATPPAEPTTEPTSEGAEPATEPAAPATDEASPAAPAESTDPAAATDEPTQPAEPANDPNGV